MRAIVILVLMFLTSPAFAEEIVLNNGMTVQGTITERSDKWIKVNASGVDVTYYLDEVQLIDGKSVVGAVSQMPKATESLPAVSPQSSNDFTTKTEQVLSTEISAPLIQSAKSFEVESATPQTARFDPAAADQLSDSSRVSSKSSKQLTPTEATIALVLALIFIGIILVIFCYPVFLIAKKTQTAHPFFAFIPILNYYLICTISGRPVWWMILYLIPLVNLIIDMLVWMNIAKVRRRPEWLGALALIPLGNIGMMWYLALSDPQPGL